jgi:hypothetical protein
MREQGENRTLQRLIGENAGVLVKKTTHHSLADFVRAGLLPKIICTAILYNKCLVR